MPMREFIHRNRVDIDQLINEEIYRHDGRGGRGVIPAPAPTYSDAARREWVLNHEPLYRWARADGVRI